MIPNSKKRLSCSITAENQFSTDTSGGTPQNASGTKGFEIYGKFALRLRGTWTANVVGRRSSDNGVNWEDITDNTGTLKTFTANGVYTGEEPARGVLYQFGVKTGGFTSGTVVLEIQQ